MSDAEQPKRPSAETEAAVSAEPAAAGPHGEEGASEKGGRAEPARRRRGGRWWTGVLLFLLLSAAIAAIGAWIGSRMDWVPPELMFWRQMHAPARSATQEGPSAETPAPASEPVPDAGKAAAPVAPAEAAGAGTMSAAEARALMQAIDELRARLDDFDAAWQGRIEALRAGIGVEVRLALARAAEPDSRLSEIAAGWRMAVIAAEDDAARKQAQAYWREARAVLDEAEAMRRALEAARERLIGEGQHAPRNLLAIDVPGLGWLGAWFRLYRAPDRELAARRALAERLAAVAAGLARGRAPSAEAWMRLRAEAQTALDALGASALAVQMPAEALVRLPARVAALRQAAAQRIEEGAR